MTRKWIVGLIDFAGGAAAGLLFHAPDLGDDTLPAPPVGRTEFTHAPAGAAR